MPDVQFVKPEKLGSHSLQADKATAGKRGLLPLINTVVALALVVVVAGVLKGDFNPAPDPATQPAASLPLVNAATGKERGSTHNLKREFAMTIEEVKAASPRRPSLPQLNAVVVGEVHWTPKNPAVRINHRLHTVGDRVIGVPDEYRVVHIMRSRVYISDPAGKLLEFPTGVHRAPADLEIDPTAPGPGDMDAPIGNLPDND